MFCPNCGNDCEDAKFCSNCGFSLQGKAATTDTEARKKHLRETGQVYCPLCLSASIANCESKHIQNEHLLYRNPIAKIIAIIIQEVRRKRTKK